MFIVHAKILRLTFLDCRTVWCTLHSRVVEVWCATVTLADCIAERVTPSSTLRAPLSGTFLQKVVNQCLEFVRADVAGRAYEATPAVCRSIVLRTHSLVVEMWREYAQSRLLVLTVIIFVKVTV